MSRKPTPRRTLLAATLAAAAGVTALPATAAGRSTRAAQHRSASAPTRKTTVAYRAWTTLEDWQSGAAHGTRAEGGRRPGIVLAAPEGTVDYADPHGGTETATWEYARWTSPVHDLATPAGELVASWNAHTPVGSWLRIELKGSYTDGSDTPWYTLGIWTAGDGDDVPRRTSVDDQSDGRSTIWTDTFAIDDTDSDLRLASYRLRLTLLRAPGGGATPKVWRLGAMTSDVPDRFEVPATEPGEAAGIELDVPRYSQDIHIGRYPEYDNGGEAWCSPTSSQMIVEYWGREPTPEDLAWVNPDYDDPQVCHAARHTYDYTYEGCGNWPFNTAYCSTYPDLQGIVTRLATLHDAEHLIRAGIPLITSQSFIASELDGAGYGTAGHLMTVIGFTEDGDVIANDPAGDDNAAVRRVYKRRQWEKIWLRTKRHNADGKVVGGTGGICYLYFPARPSPAQRRALKSLGIR